MCLSFFHNQKKEKFENIKLKEKEKVVNTLAARIEKLTTGDSESAVKLKSLQVNYAPGLVADADDIPYRQNNKWDLRVYL